MYIYIYIYIYPALLRPCAWRAGGAWRRAVSPASVRGGLPPARGIPNVQDGRLADVLQGNEYKCLFKAMVFCHVESALRERRPDNVGVPARSAPRGVASPEKYESGGLPKHPACAPRQTIPCGHATFCLLPSFFVWASAEMTN